ncbi:FHA domain-containing protein [Caballeronia concitans]|uniref:FHA domain protein n=1 Tax=Caballeronia concitans TaxID=1777133 RepID=A0A658QWB5_9BURK|nr:FHA domain-containing protein [Caballeronia concitans]KIG03811.1 FHA domain containing protein [Burkholderia sp. MR1]SAL28552.1 FHA domain protein [Caballeronia concitans]
MAPGDPIAEQQPSVGEAFDVVLKPVSRGDLDDPLSDIRIDENLFAIGRAEPPFDESPPDAVAQLSRRHARIFIEHGHVYIADLGSKNGTAVNGTPVRDVPARVRDGDEISFGNRLAYRVQFAPRKRRTIPPKPVTVTLVPQHEDRGLLPIDVVQFPFLVSKTDETFARYRAEYPHQVNYVSRRHAHVFVKGGAPFVEDLGSTNGTFVNGHRITEHAVELKNGDTLAFGGTHFAYRVQVHGDESESTLTQMAAASSAKDQIHDEHDSDKTTFVGSAHSFLDIFCIDQTAPADEVNEDAHAAEHAPHAGDGKKRGKLTLFIAELGKAFAADDRRGARRTRVIAACVLAALVAVGVALFYGGAPERHAKSLMASGDYTRAATFTDGYLKTHPDDARFVSMNTEAVLKSNVPRWLGALRNGDYRNAETILAQMDSLSEHNTDVRSLLDELRWIGKLERFVMGRGGPDAPIRMYADEARIDEILKHWDADASGHQRDLDRIAGYVPEFREPYALALSHLRKLQSDDSVYLAAIDRLNASIVNSLASDDLDSVDSTLKEYAEKYPRLGGLDRIRADADAYANVKHAMNEPSLAPLALALKKTSFSTPPFQQRFTQMSASQLPPPDVLAQYAAVSNAWGNGDSARAIDGLHKFPQGTWSPTVQKEIAHKQSVAAQFADLQRARGSKQYEDALLSFYETLDLQADGYFAKAVAPEMSALKTKAAARVQALMNQAQALWTQYRTNGGIGGSQRLESGISDTFRTQARLLSDAQEAAARGMRISRQVNADAGKWTALVSEIDNEVDLQRRSLQDLRMVLEPALLQSKLALIKGAGGEARRAP